MCGVRRSCDYGISSCVGLFAMTLLGRPLERFESVGRVSCSCCVYDGSWIEYSQQKDAAIELC